MEQQKKILVCFLSHFFRENVLHAMEKQKEHRKPRERSENEGDTVETKIRFFGGMELRFHSTRGEKHSRGKKTNENEESQKHSQP